MVCDIFAHFLNIKIKACVKRRQGRLQSLLRLQDHLGIHHQIINLFTICQLASLGVQDIPSFIGEHLAVIGLLGQDLLLVILPVFFIDHDQPDT